MDPYDSPFSSLIVVPKTHPPFLTKNDSFFSVWCSKRGHKVPLKGSIRAPFKVLYLRFRV